MDLNTGIKWESEVPTREFRQITSMQLRELGLVGESTKIVSDLKELRNSPPNIVIAHAVKNLSFIQNFFKKQKLKKGNNYVMGLGVYQQLHREPRGGRKFLKPAKVQFKNLYTPYIGQDLTNKTLLVFRTGGIGDLLFIQPNLSYLKEKYPSCTINFCCGPQYQSMVETWECVDRVVDLPFNLTELNRADYHALFEGVIERCKLAEQVNAYNLFSEWLGLDLPNDKLVPSQKPKDDKVEFCLEKLQEWGVQPKGFMLTQLRASSPIRTPRPEFWINIIDELTDRGHDVLITDNPRQKDNVDNFISAVKNKHRVFNFCQHSLSLDFSIAVASLAKCVIATDSALNHIAASLDVPCYGIYGPFPGHIRLKTYPKARWVDAQRHCVPCFIHGHTPCPEAGPDGYSPCYDQINIKETIDNIEELSKDG
jgi:ADP-heptose:LPS heptosyltransferase